MLKKKGVTLIEIIIVLGISIMVCGLSVGNYYYIYNTASNDFSVDMCSNSILRIINNSKIYCKSKNKSGYLLFDYVEGIKFYCEGKKVASYILPEGFKLKAVISKTGHPIIYIDNFGNTADACTISYEDRKGENHSITLRVGTNYVEIK